MTCKAETDKIMVTAFKMMKLLVRTSKENLHHYGYKTHEEALVTTVTLAMAAVDVVVRRHEEALRNLEPDDGI